MGACHSREAQPQRADLTNAEKPSQRSPRKGGGPRKNRKSILHPKLHIEGVPDITEASSSDSASAAAGRNGSNYGAADFISPRTVQTIASGTPDSLYSSSNIRDELPPPTSVVDHTIQTHQHDNSPPSADHPEAITPYLRTNYNEEQDDEPHCDSIKDAGTETYRQIMHLQSLVLTANGKLSIKPSTPPRKSPTKHSKHRQKLSASQGVVEQLKLSPPRGLTAGAGSKYSPKRGKDLSTRLVPLDEEQETCCSEGNDCISIIPEEVDPDAPSDEEEYREDLIRNTPPDEPGRLVPVKWRTAFARMPKPTSIQMRPSQPLPPPLEPDDNENDADDDNVSESDPGMKGLTPAQRELRRELAKRNAEHEYLKKAREKWKAKQKRSQQAVDLFAMSQFQKLQLQVQLADRQARQSAKVNKLEDRFKDVQEYKKLWKQYETLQNDIQMFTHSSVSTSANVEENDAKSLPSSDIAEARPRRRANSFDLKDSKNWFFDFQKVDFKSSGPDGAKSRKSAGESLSLLSAKSMEVQRRLFAEKRRERKRKEKERKGGSVHGSTIVSSLATDVFDCNDTYKASGGAGGVEAATVSRTYSYESSGENNFHHPPRDYGPKNRGGTITVVRQSLSRSNSATSFTDINIEVSFSSPDHGYRFLQEQGRQTLNVDTALDDASMVSDLADDNSTLASGSHFNNDYRVPRRHRARFSVSDDVSSMASGSAYSYSKRSRATRHSKNSSTVRRQGVGTNVDDKNAIQARIQSLESAVASLVAKNTNENQNSAAAPEQCSHERSVNATTTQHDAATAELLKVFEALSAPSSHSMKNGDKTPLGVRKALLDSLAGQLQTAELLANESRGARDDVRDDSPSKAFLEQAAAGVSIVHKANHAMLHAEQPSSYVVAQVRALATPSVLSASSSVCSLRSSTSHRFRHDGAQKQSLPNPRSPRSHQKIAAATLTKTQICDPPGLRRLTTQDNLELTLPHLSVPCPPESLGKSMNNGEKVRSAGNERLLRARHSLIDEKKDDDLCQKNYGESTLPYPVKCENPVESGLFAVALESNSHVDFNVYDRSTSQATDRSRSNESQQREKEPTPNKQCRPSQSNPFQLEVLRPAKASSALSKSPYDPVIYSLSTEQFLCLAERPHFDHLDLVPSDEESAEGTMHPQEGGEIKENDNVVATMGTHEHGACDSHKFHGNDKTGSKETADAGIRGNQGEIKFDGNSVCVKPEHDALDNSFLAEFRERGYGADAAYQNLLLAEKVEAQVKTVLSKYREVEDVASRTSPSSGSIKSDCLVVTR